MVGWVIKRCTFTLDVLCDVVEILLLFGMGTLPLLWVVQAAFSRWQGSISPVMISRIQRSLALVVAIILGLRLYFFETGQSGLFCGS